jgi:hypothetical protein
MPPIRLASRKTRRRRGRDEQADLGPRRVRDRPADALVPDRVGDDVEPDADEEHGR